MKFINYLESISGIGIFPLTSLLIFFLFFVGLAVKVYMMDPKALDTMNRIPLDEEDSKSNN